MKLSKFKYYEPHKLEEAVSLLDRYGHIAGILAGGTDLLPLMKQRIVKPKYVINIKSLKNLDFIKDDKGIQIGALTTSRTIEKSDILREKCPILPDTASGMAYIQVRNRGTIGGNICNASPAADFAPVLMVLDAEVRIASIKEENFVSINDFFLGPGRTILNRNEMVIGLNIPNYDDGIEMSFKKVPSRTNKGLAVASAAVISSIDEHTGVVREARIAVGSMGPTPIRCLNTEKLLIGKKINHEIINTVSERIVEETNPISDIRGTKEYRTHLIKVITQQALRDVYRRYLS